MEVNKEAEKSCLLDHFPPLKLHVIKLELLLLTGFNRKCRFKYDLFTDFNPVHNNKIIIKIKMLIIILSK